MEQEAQSHAEEVPVSNETQNEAPVEEEKQQTETETVGAAVTKTDSSDEWDDDDSSSSFKKHTANAALGKMFSRSRQQAPEINVEEVWKKEEAMTQEERRKRYKAREINTLDDITPWSQQGPTLPSDSNESKYSINSTFNEKVSLWHGDITTLEIDAVVNAANETCLGGGGIDGAIHRAAGPQLYEECRTLHGCPTGQTKITRGYNLPAKYILHTVGPVGENPEMLESCYKTCLELVEKHNIKTVAFCGISTGIFGYPLFPASRIAIETVRKWLESGEKNVERVIFCTFLAKEKDCYEKLMPIYFPVQVEEEKVQVEENKQAQEEEEKKKLESEQAAKKQKEEEEEEIRKKKQEEEKARNEEEAKKKKLQQESEELKKKQQESEQQQAKVTIEEVKEEPRVVVVEEDTSANDIKIQEDAIRKRLEEREKNKASKKLGKREEVDKQQQSEKEEKLKQDALKRQEEQRQKRLNKKPTSSASSSSSSQPRVLTSSSTSVFDETTSVVVEVKQKEEETLKKPAAKLEKKSTPAVSEGFLLKKNKKDEEKEGKEVVKEEEKIPTKFILGGVFFVTAWAISFLLKRK